MMVTGKEMRITSEGLVEFMVSYEMYMQLSIKVAEIFLGYMVGHGYYWE